MNYRFSDRSTAIVPAAGVLFGLEEVDPAFYRGWRGECPGCIQDTASFGGLCGQAGIPVTIGVNNGATKAGAVDRARAAIDRIAPGGLLVLYFSGHGGQMPDGDGDEEDGMDETICLWDGPLVDDLIWKGLDYAVRRNVRIWMVTDSCNSGTNYRGPHRYAPVAAVAGAPRLLHWGGCSDGEASFGGRQGGAFTNAICRAFAHCMTYRELFAAASGKMELWRQMPTKEMSGETFEELEVFK